MSNQIITNTCKITLEGFEVVQMLYRVNCISLHIYDYRCHIYIMEHTLSRAIVMLFSDKKTMFSSMFPFPSKTMEVQQRLLILC